MFNKDDSDLIGGYILGTVLILGIMLLFALMSAGVLVWANSMVEVV